MDLLKSKTLMEYTCKEIKCKYIGSNKGKRLYKTLFRKIARKRLKEEDRHVKGEDK